MGYLRLISSRFAKPLCALLSIAALTSCGVGDIAARKQIQSSTTTDNPAGIPIDSTLNEPKAQQELLMVMEEVHRYIIDAVTVPAAQLKARQAAGIRSAFSGCSPDFNIVMIGVGITFQGNDQCNLNGTISVKFFPLKATVDLDVVGLQFVKSISFDADIILGDSGTNSTVSVQFLDGNISLESISFVPIKDLVLNGMAAVEFGSNLFKLNVRTNAFDRGTLMGMALLSSVLDDSNGSTVFKGCYLTGGNPLDPNAGTLAACFDF